MGKVTEEILLKAKNETKQAFNEVESSARKAGGAVKQSFDWVGAAAVASVVLYGVGKAISFVVGEAAKVDATGQTQDSLDNLKNSAERLEEALLSKLQPTIRWITGELADWFDQMTTEQQALDALNQAVQEGTITGNEYRKMMTQLKTGKIEASEVTRQLALDEDTLTQAMRYQNVEGEKMNKLWGISGSEMVLTGMRAQDVAVYERKAAEEARAAARALEEAAQAAQNALQRELDVMQIWVGGAMDKEIKNFNERQDDFKKKASEIRIEIDKLKTRTYFTPTQKQELKDLQSEFKRLSSKEGLTSGQAEKLALITKRIEDLTSKKYLTAAQREELKKLKGDLAEVNTAIAENVAAHDEATKRILWNMAVQRASMDGLTGAEITALGIMGEAWGIFGPATREAWDKTNEFFTNLDGALDLSTRKVVALTDELLGIPKLIDVHVNIWTTEYYTSGGERGAGGGADGQSVRPRKPKARKGGTWVWNGTEWEWHPYGGSYAGGGSFIVPGSGGGDQPYLLGLRPGEQVDVTPTGKTSGGGDTYVDMTVIQRSGENSAEFAARLKRDLLRSRYAGQAGQGYSG
jgi:hypothetical protein